MTQSNRAGALYILPQVEGLGGPASFRARLVSGLRARGIKIANSLNEPGIATVLVIGGISRLDILVKLRRRGIRIVQRLNGMNWIHRRRFTGVQHFLKSEWNNFVLATIRRSLADRIIYQSQFARTWWQTVYHTVQASSSVIYNGIDLNQFSPGGPEQPPADRYRLLLVEGRLGWGNEQGLDNAVQLGRKLNEMLDRRVELRVVGAVPAKLAARYDHQNPGLVNWTGVIHRDQVPPVDRSAHVLFSADLNAACPNSVIEALACGLPVVSFATGSLPEMIEGDAGVVVPWGSNFWRLEPPDIDSLAGAAARVIREQDHFRLRARARAETIFGLDDMVEKYLEVMLG